MAGCENGSCIGTLQVATPCSKSANFYFTDAIIVAQMAWDLERANSTPRLLVFGRLLMAGLRNVL